MLFKRISCFLLSSIFAAAVLATPVHAAEKQTPSGLSFSDVGNDIETFVQENEDELASIQTAVFCDQTTLYEGYFGYANKENEMLSDQNTVYEWGSVSKLFVWVSIMQLYEQDFVKLDADIRTYLPAGFLTKTAYTDPITLIDLMNHTAGWQETICSLEVADEAELVPLEYALKNTEPAQVYAPGEVTAYSNWGAALAGYIVQYVSGQDYAEYVHEHILDPLGMEHTSVAADYRDNMWVREQREKLSSYMKSESMDRALGQR
ncbi:MAG: serine hydrolase [Oscillospiraceae bacterium]|nr:serine hydrolase [Oscillospiraceae bacterium]